MIASTEQEREAAIKVLAKWLTPSLAPSAELEKDWHNWLHTLFLPWVSDAEGNPVPFAPHLAQIWDWFWKIRLGSKQEPLIACLPRGGAKSTTAELGVAACAARRTRKYCLYICATQPQADDHIQNIGALLESSEFSKFYPAAANKRVNKYGYSSGWNRQRLRTASGFTADAIGLDTAARGIKLEETRPDLIIFDDIDSELDTAEATEKKIKLITTKMLPAGSRDSVVMGVQNLIIEDGVFARLTDHPTITKPADFLQNRIVIGPLPAIQNPVVVMPKYGDAILEQHPELRERIGKWTIISGEPVWEGQNLKKAQSDIDEWGYSAWKTEAQQDVASPDDGLFANIDFDAITVPLEAVPELIRVVIWCDPAVTDTKRSDSHGVIADGLGVDDKLYRLRAWEGRASPGQVLERAFLWAIELHADHIGIETDQGGDLWEIAYNKAWEEFITNFPSLNLKIGDRIPLWTEKAGAGYGSKSHRGSLMLRDYEDKHEMILHVADPDHGYHLTLKRALLRAFVKKPFDLADAAFWGWNDLKGQIGGGIGASSDEPANAYSSRRGVSLANALHGANPDTAYSAQHSDRLRIGRLWAGHAGQRSLWRQPVVARPDAE